MFKPPQVKHWLLLEPEFLDYLKSIGLSPDDIDWDDQYLVQEFIDLYDQYLM